MNFMKYLLQVKIVWDRLHGHPSSVPRSRGIHKFYEERKLRVLYSPVC